jgi:hypothetical protein
MPKSSSSSSSSSSEDDKLKPNKEKKDKKRKLKSRERETTEAGPRLVVLIRHGEKPTPKHLDFEGLLSKIGQLRARFLAERYFSGPNATFFQSSNLAGHKITHLFATKPDYAAKKRLRMELTMRPLAESLGLQLNLEHDADSASALIKTIRGLAGKNGRGRKGPDGVKRRPDIVLVCFPHEHIPAIARELLLNGIREADKGDFKWRVATPVWDKDDYSSVWVVRPGGVLEVLDMDEVPRGWAGAKEDFFEGFAEADVKRRAKGVDM